MTKPQLSGVYYASGGLAPKGDVGGAGLLLQTGDRLSALLHLFRKPEVAIPSADWLRDGLRDGWQFHDPYWRELDGLWIDIHGRLTPPFISNRATIEGLYGTFQPRHAEGPTDWSRVEGEYISVESKRELNFRFYKDRDAFYGELLLLDWIDLGDISRTPAWADFYQFHLSVAQPWSLLVRYDKYQEPLKRYLGQSYGPTNVFVMMRFRDTEDSHRLRDVLRKALKDEGLVAQFADEMSYTDELWDNVCTFMLGSRFGIAVVEEIEERSFNPNVAIEIGFMQALQRKILVLKDRRVPMLPADLIGRLYKEFDSYHMEETIPPVIHAWAEELRVLGQLPKRITDRESAT